MLYLIGPLNETINHVGYCDIATLHLCMLQTWQPHHEGCESRFFARGLNIYWIAIWCSEWDGSETAASSEWVAQSKLSRQIESSLWSQFCFCTPKHNRGTFYELRHRRYQLFKLFASTTCLICAINLISCCSFDSLNWVFFFFASMQH